MVAKFCATPLPDVLAMRFSEFQKWHRAALKVWEDTRLKFE